ncbi:MAG: tetratricopeptide (TPR) repeat protein [Gammaproteobacteria bacterium]|jgi:tetratricopeptide (TPR) repeat protein
MRKKIKSPLSHRAKGLDRNIEFAERHLTDATRAHQDGKLTVALQTYRKYLKCKPDDGQIWHRIGGILFQLGKLAQAITALENACQLDPNDSDIASDLGGMYLSTEQFSKAEAALKSALKLVPDSVGAHYNLSIALVGQNRISESTTCLLRAVEIQPDFVDAHYNLGVAFRIQGNYPKALSSFERVHHLEPVNLAVRLDLARCYRDSGLAERSVSHYEDYLAHTNANQIILEFAELLNAIGLAERAENLVLDQITVSPNDARLQAQVGIIRHNRGDLGGAESSLHRALELDPNCVSAIVELSRLRRYEDPHTPILIQLKTTLNRAKPESEETVALNFALGKVYDDLGCYDDAFRHYKLGNELKRARHSYSLDSVKKRYSEIINYFDRQNIAALRELSSDSDVPILVVGMPRSGTTLIEQIISSHPGADGAGELQYFPSVAQQLPHVLGSDQPYPKCLADFDQKSAATITSNYLDLLRRHSKNGQRVTDKLPGNFVNLGLFASLFPNGRIISCRRDPVDMALSIYFQYFADKHDYAWDLVRIASHYAEYDRLMRHWQSLFPEMIMEIHYADTVSDVEAVARNLMTFCELPWDAEVLNFYEAKRDVKTASSWQVRQPIYGRSLARWKHYEQHISALLEALSAHRH